MVSFLCFTVFPFRIVLASADNQQRTSRHGPQRKAMATDVQPVVVGRLLKAKDICPRVKSRRRDAPRRLRPDDDLAVAHRHSVHGKGEHFRGRPRPVVRQKRIRGRARTAHALRQRKDDLVESVVAHAGEATLEMGRVAVRQVKDVRAVALVREVVIRAPRRAAQLPRSAQFQRIDHKWLRRRIRSHE